jgi:hypothetical protein
MESRSSRDGAAIRTRRCSLKDESSLEPKYWRRQVDAIQRFYETVTRAVRTHLTLQSIE